MLVAFVQMDCYFGRVGENIDRAVDLIRSEKADLYVLPELFNTGYLFTTQDELSALAEPIPNGPTTLRLAEVARQENCYIVAGLAERAGKDFFNSSILLAPDGWLATYRKIHLFDEEKLWFKPGDRPFFVVDIGMAKLGMMICFDWIFPESMRSLALAGADIICHSANLVLPYCQKAMVTRCLENGVFAITANRVGSEKRGDKELTFTGKSQITGTRGEILAHASIARDEVYVVQVDPVKARDKNLTARNHLFDDRRPEMYRS